MVARRSVRPGPRAARRATATTVRSLHVRRHGGVRGDRERAGLDLLAATAAGAREDQVALVGRLEGDAGADGEARRGGGPGGDIQARRGGGDALSTTAGGREGERGGGSNAALVGNASPAASLGGSADTA